MKYKRFLFSLFLSVSLSTFAVAQSHKHDHAKMQMKSDTSRVKDAHEKTIKERYTCSMHPEVVSDRPGKCHKCGMKLVKAKTPSIIEKSHKMQKDTTKSHPDKMH
jgi:hypothetical protein